MFDSNTYIQRLIHWPLCRANHQFLSRPPTNVSLHALWLPLQPYVRELPPWLTPGLSGSLARRCSRQLEMGIYRAGAQSPHPFHRLTGTQDGVEQGLTRTYGREQGKSWGKQETSGSRSKAEIWACSAAEPGLKFAPSPVPTSDQNQTPHSMTMNRKLWRVTENLTLKRMSSKGGAG